MPLPAFSGGVGLDWWRIEETTPPAFSLTGFLDGSTATIIMDLPFDPPIRPAPLVGQLVSGTGIPALATVASVDTASFTISAATTAPGNQTLSIGVEPVSIDEANAWAIVENPDQPELVADLIRAARQMAEAHLKRALITQAKTLYFACFPSTGYLSLAVQGLALNRWWIPSEQGIIQLPYPMLQSIVSVKYLDTNNTLRTVDPSAYTFTRNATPGRIQAAYGTSWPVARPQVDAVQITYICGYGPTAAHVPVSIRLAMRSLISSGYKERDAYAGAFVAGGKLAATLLYEKLLQTEDFGSYS